MNSTFFFSAYWGRWSRIIGKENGYIYELDLTPIGGYHGDWGRISTEVFRAHGTGRGNNDREMDRLPPEEVKDMVFHFGQRLTDRMLHYDYLTEITLSDIKTACQKSNGGGVPLTAIKEIRAGARTFWQNK